MDWLKIANDAKAKMEALLNTVKAEKRAFTDEEKTQYDGLQKEVDNALGMAEREANLTNINTRMTEPNPDPGNTSPPRVDVHPDGRDGPFNTFADQLVAVRNAAGGQVDDRLNIVNAALGMNEGVSKDGGWAVQSDFAGMLINTAVKDDPLLSRVDSYQVSAKSNSVQWIDILETSIESTVFGGVKVYWAEEAGTVDATKPQLKEKELKLMKLMGFAYVTDELNADSSFVDQLYRRAFQTALRRELAACIISGTGVGKPLGILNSPALVTVDKESGQTAATVVWENISKMYHRALDKSGMLWVMNPDVSQQLDFLQFAVGTAGVPVYLPATMTGTVDSLRAKQIIESDHCSALGTAGDILFVDPREYVMIYKGGVKTDVSIHVQFLTAQNCFRFIFRANGMPKRSNTLTLKNSSNARSPYIALQTRS